MAGFVPFGVCAELGDAGAEEDDPAVVEVFHAAEDLQGTRFVTEASHGMEGEGAKGESGACLIGMEEALAGDFGVEEAGFEFDDEEEAPVEPFGLEVEGGEAVGGRGGRGAFGEDLAEFVEGGVGFGGAGAGVAAVAEGVAGGGGFAFGRAGAAGFGAVAAGGFALEFGPHAIRLWGMG